MFSQHSFHNLIDFQHHVVLIYIINILIITVSFVFANDELDLAALAIDGSAAATAGFKYLFLICCKKFPKLLGGLIYNTI